MSAVKIDLSLMNNFAMEITGTARATPETPAPPAAVPAAEPAKTITTNAAVPTTSAVKTNPVNDGKNYGVDVGYILTPPEPTQQPKEKQ